MLVNTPYLEMVARADSSLMTIIGLQAGVALDIEKYGSDELQAALPAALRRRASCRDAMDLTEPQAGSDLGGIVTRATREGDRYFIDGEKIFITNGGAQVHLVLARDAAHLRSVEGHHQWTQPAARARRRCPTGGRTGCAWRGSSRSSASTARRRASSSSTTPRRSCSASRGQGFRAMLDLMNNARLGVAAQAIGIAEAAYQAAREYAAQRVQFGAPIIQQPLVKSMLTLMRDQHRGGARAALPDLGADRHDGGDPRAPRVRPRPPATPTRTKLQHELERNTQLIRFFTPLCKYYATEISNHVTRQGIQVHGGIGYMAESPAGHYHSDSIITTIYEGTSEIQASFALKEMAKGALFATLESIETELDGLRAHRPELVEMVCDGVKAIRDGVPTLMGDPQYALLNAKRVCEMVIDVVVSAELLCQADVSEGRLELAQSFVHRHIPAVQLNAGRISSGDASRIARYDKILGLTSETP